jgi:hypothetical protein
MHQSSRAAQRRRYRIDAFGKLWSSPLNSLIHRIYRVFQPHLWLA